MRRGNSRRGAGRWTERRAGQAYEVGGEHVTEVDALQSQGRGESQHHVLGAQRSGGRVQHQAALAVRVDGGDGSAQAQGILRQRGREGGGEALRSGGETARGRVDQVAGEAACPGGVLEHGVPGEVLGERLDAASCRELPDVLLSVPEPGGSQVQGPLRARCGDGEQASADAVAGFQAEHVAAGGVQGGGRGQSGGAGADHDHVVAVPVGHVWLPFSRGVRASGSRGASGPRGAEPVASWRCGVAPCVGSGAGRPEGVVTRRRRRRGRCGSGGLPSAAGPRRHRPAPVACVRSGAVHRAWRRTPSPPPSRAGCR